MADYREHSREIESADASIVAVSVDPPETSELLRVQFSLPFPILCDTERRVIRDWGIFNAQERGGIAKPAVFILDQKRTVRYVSVDTVVKRVPATWIVQVLTNSTEGRPVRRTFFIPRLLDWVRAIRNNFR